MTKTFYGFHCEMCTRPTHAFHAHSFTPCRTVHFTKDDLLFFIFCNIVMLLTCYHYPTAFQNRFLCSEFINSSMTVVMLIIHNESHLLRYFHLKAPAKSYLTDRVENVDNKFKRLQRMHQYVV